MRVGIPAGAWTWRSETGQPDPNPCRM